MKRSRYWTIEGFEGFEGDRGRAFFKIQSAEKGEGGRKKPFRLQRCRYTLTLLLNPLGVPLFNTVTAHQQKIKLLFFFLLMFRAAPYP